MLPVDAWSKGFVCICPLLILEKYNLHYNIWLKTDRLDLFTCRPIHIINNTSKLFGFVGVSMCICIYACANIFSEFVSPICNFTKIDFNTICNASTKLFCLLTHFPLKRRQWWKKGHGPRTLFGYYHVGHSQYKINDGVLLSPKGAIGHP